MLEHGQENDYVLPKHESCWITVGNRSVYITNNAGLSGQKVAVFELNKEDGEPLMVYHLDNDQ